MNRAAYVIDSTVSSFPFWDNQPHFYTDLDRLFVQHDLVRLHQAVAKCIADQLPGRELIRWLDVGSGDGSTLGNVLKQFISLRTDVRVQLDCIEPSRAALNLLPPNVIIPKVALQEMHEGPISTAKLLETHDVVTCIHTSYYFGQSEANHKVAWAQIADTLVPGGIAVSCVLPEISPFFELAAPTRYSSYGKEESVKLYMSSLFKGISSAPLPMRIPTELLFDDSSNLKLFYEFLHHQNKIPDAQEVYELRRKLRMMFDGSAFIDMLDKLVIGVM